jgi:hypothetical protein
MWNHAAPRKRFAAPFAALLLAAISTVGFADPSKPVVPHRVLFVGNSIIYTNNLPAVLHALIQTQRPDAEVRIDMFAKGGATLAETAADLRFRVALRNGHYDAVVLQERGGDAICAANAEARGETACREMIRGERDLADAVRRAGASVYFLGTYQPMPQASAALVEGERWLAARMPARYIETSQTWQALRGRLPDLHWLYAEGDSHPGPATTALLALRSYAALFGTDPQAADICTSARRLTPRDGSDDVVPFESLIADAGPATCLLTKTQVAQFIGR